MIPFPRHPRSTPLALLAGWAVISVTGLGSERVIAQSSMADATGPPRDAFQRELLRLADICDSLGLEAEAKQSRGWLPPLRNDRRCLYLPVEPASAADGDLQRSSWARHFSAAREEFAEHLFRLAGRALEEEDEQAAYLLLWRVLREDPSHSEARRILGPLATAMRVRPQVRRATAAHPEFAWPAGSYHRVETPHFKITGRGETSASVQLARQLEQFYALWSQVFYPLWAPPGQLAARFAGGSAAWPHRQALQVVWLADRDDYLTTLGVAETNIGVSVGYYAPHLRKSFFYPDASLSKTLQHELTHQLLAEATSIDARVDAGSQSGFWLIEGIALYMESLTAADSYWTLGGVESERLQTARYRAARDGYWPGWEEFTRAGMEDWKQDPQIALLYTQAAGLTHLFMDHLDTQPPARDVFLKSLVSVYQGAVDSSALWELLGGSEEAAKLKYQQTLILDDEQLQAMLSGGSQPHALVLAGSELSTAAWHRLSELSELRWFDASFSNADDDRLEWLPQNSQLRRLSLEGSLVQGKVLQKVAELNSLEELDLSQCAVEDAALQPLRGHPRLKIVWLTATEITDATIELLSTLPSLEFCDVGGTKIKESSWHQFVARHPRLAEP